MGEASPRATSTYCKEMVQKKDSLSTIKELMGYENKS